MPKEKKGTSVVRGAGDNAPDKPIDGAKLEGFIVDLEKLDKKTQQVLQERREVYADAKAIGYDGKTIRKILRKRKIGPEKAKEEQELLDLYQVALGMVDE